MASTRSMRCPACTTTTCSTRCSRPATASRTIHTRHEQGAAYLALGAALATARPQVYTVVPGPGLLNSSAALLTAYGMNAPVLGLIGQIAQSAIGRGFGHLHEIRDQAGIISPPRRFLRPHPRAGGGARRWSRRRSARWRPAGPARRCWNAPSTCGAASAPVAPIAPPSPPPEPVINEDAIRDAAKRLGAAQAPADHLRRRRARRLAGSHRAVAHAAGAGAGLSGAAAACSTAAIRSA